MEIKYFMPRWGNEHLPLPDFFKKIKDSGYHGVEMSIPYNEEYADKLKDLLGKNNLLLIAQQNIPFANESIEKYIEQLQRHLIYLASFNPLFINSHTGKDYFSFEDNCRIIKAAEIISANTGVNVYHETHRGRCLYSAPMAKLYFDELPELKISADFSHWCCVSESLLEGQDDLMYEAIKRTKYIHARVGYSQGPQVNHPFAPENNEALDKHLFWWQKIIDHQKMLGTKIFPLATEFGPKPYLQTLPFTNREVADLFQINLGMKSYLINRLNI
ncbi:TIM barrel protein [uncultured Sunxiuqinia sp.]|uniref:sugar phosphate isomerase/epimerase family protein n=1 Tax=uncultured Sunxiuqinia sp. TaxID=1573825 RepID=UPI0026284ADF|nr:TIM barrel protein [uncultured Sunxiuqinia sp.]